MYPSRTFSSALLLAVTSQLVSSSPITPTLARRQDTVLAGFQLLGPDADCFDFSFKGNTFSATCVSVDAAPVSSSVNLDQCITNAMGNMGYLFNGGAFGSCSDCTLKSDTLELTCNCATGAHNMSQMSTINLDGTAEDNENGVFVRDNGRVDCRAPNAA